MLPFVGRRRHRTTVRVIALFVAEPLREWSGYEIARRLGVSGGLSLAALAELEAAGALVSRREDRMVAALSERRPRRYYRIAPGRRGGGM